MRWRFPRKRIPRAHNRNTKHMLCRIIVEYCRFDSAYTELLSLISNSFPFIPEACLEESQSGVIDCRTTSVSSFSFSLNLCAAFNAAYLVLNLPILTLCSELLPGDERTILTV